MTDWICKEVHTDIGGYFEPVTELIRCKDCKYNPENAMSYLDDDLIEGYIHCGHLGDDGFCSLGKREEE